MKKKITDENGKVYVKRNHFIKKDAFGFWQSLQ